MRSESFPRCMTGSRKAWKPPTSSERRRSSQSGKRPNQIDGGTTSHADAAVMVNMQAEARRLLVPLIHRFWPSCGPGGLVDFVLSKALDADAENTVHVTRYFDVMEVLDRDDDFSVRLYD